jgi:Fic family protein
VGHGDWTPRLIRVLSDADRLIGKLAGEGGRLPNPHILMRPFLQREAVLSSKIEGTQATLGELLAAVRRDTSRRGRQRGTQATLGELLAAEAGVAVDRSPDDLRRLAIMLWRSNTALSASRNLR